MIYIRAILVCLCVSSICYLTGYFYGGNVREKSVRAEYSKAVSDYKERELNLIAELYDAQHKRQDQYGKGSSIIEHAIDTTDCFDAPVPDVAFNELLDASHR